MTERTYRLWAYSPSHSRLILRSVGGEPGESNIDHLFTGVTEMKVPTTISDLVVHKASPGGEPMTIPSGCFFWELDGRSELGLSENVGWIVAAEYSVDENDRELFDTQLNDLAAPAQAAFEFERHVLLALAPYGLRDTTPSDTDGFDFMLNGRSGGRVAVEAKWFRGRPTRRSIRALADRIGSSMTAGIDDVVVVFGGVDQAEREDFSKTLRSELITALHAYTAGSHVVPGDDATELRRSIESLVAP